MQDFRFPHLADIYYSTQYQGDNGEMRSRWELGHEGMLCELHSDKFNSDLRYAIDAKGHFFNFPLLLFGRFKEDIRKDKDGNYHPISDMLVTNVRDDCTGRKLFIEAEEIVDRDIDLDDIDVLFEFRSFAPFTNPWGQIEYYRTQVYRMNDQDFGPEDSDDVPYAPSEYWETKDETPEQQTVPETTDSAQPADGTATSDLGLTGVPTAPPADSSTLTVVETSDDGWG